MKTIFITFADRKLSPTLKIIKKEAIDFGFFDEVKVYDDRTFDNEYWNKYHTFYEQNPRGFGYWIWKPYIIRRELERMNDGDVLVYLDAGCIINKNGKENYHRYVNILQNQCDIVCFEHTNCYEKQYNKIDFLDYMGLSSSQDFLESRQMIATIILIKKTQKTCSLINDWFEVMHKKPHIIDDTPSSKPELESFKEHRHDQSVFSALCYKYGIKGLPQYEVYPNGGDWSQMGDYPFWAARRKVYKRETIIKKIIRKISSFCK